MHSVLESCGFKNLPLRCTLCLKKGTLTLSIVGLKELTDFDDFWHKYS